MSINPRKTLFCVWLFSCFLQSPNFNRPISKHHEFNMAMVLNVVNSWNNGNGIINYNFTPVVNYNNKGDVSYEKSPFVINQKYYYISFGPLQFIIPYLFAKILHFEITPLFVQIIGMFIFLIAIFLVYNITSSICKKLKYHNNTALITTIFFAFFPGIMWYYTNGFMHESLNSIFYLYIFYYIINNDFFIFSKVKTTIFFLSIVLGILSDWSSFFAAFTAFLYFVYILFKQYNKRVLIISIVTFIAIIFGVGSMLYFYSKEIGFQNYLLAQQHKANTRTSDSVFSIFGGAKILFHLFTFYGPILVLILFLIIKFAKKIKWKLLGYWSIYFIPPIFYTIIFSNYSIGHEYSVLKFCLPILLLTCWAINKIKTKKWEIIFTICILNVAAYFYINPPYAFLNNKSKYKYQKEQNIGFNIQQKIKSNEFIFSDLIDDPINNVSCNTAALIYYAKRNIHFVKTKDAAINYKKNFNIIDAKFVTLKNNQIIMEDL